MTFWHWALILAVLLSSASASAARYLYLEEDLKVYSESSKAQRPIASLGTGEKVRISRKKYRGFYKVKVKVDGAFRIGFVSSDDIVLSTISSDRDQRAAQESHLYKNSYGLGLGMTYNYYTQGEREVDTQSGLVYKISSVSSSTPNFIIFFDTPAKEGIGFRLYVANRKTEFSGTVETDGDPTPDEYTIEQNFLALGGIFRSYTSDRMWWGVGLEYAKASKVEISNLETSDEDSPTWVSLLLHFGYDIKLVGPTYLMANFNGGLVVSTDPLTFSGEGQLALGMKF